MCELESYIEKLSGISMWGKMRGIDNQATHGHIFANAYAEDIPMEDTMKRLAIPDSWKILELYTSSSLSYNSLLAILKYSQCPFPASAQLSLASCPS